MRPPESFISQPIRSLQTMLRTIAEDRPGHIRVIPDGIYGPETMAAVANFQRLHALPSTGVTDQLTWEAVVAEFESARVSRGTASPLDIILNPGQILRRGERHPNIRILQAILQVLSETYESIDPPSHSGLLDDATVASLSAFQQLSGLPMSGNLDKMTWKHLSLHYPLAASLWVDTEPEYFNKS